MGGFCGAFLTMPHSRIPTSSRLGHPSAKPHMPGPVCWGSLDQTWTDILAGIPCSTSAKKLYPIIPHIGPSQVSYLIQTQKNLPTIQGVGRRFCACFAPNRLVPCPSSFSIHQKQSDNTSKLPRMPSRRFFGFPYPPTVPSRPTACSRCGSSRGVTQGRGYRPGRGGCTCGRGQSAGRGPPNPLWPRRFHPKVSDLPNSYAETKGFSGDTMPAFLFLLFAFNYRDMVDSDLSWTRVILFVRGEGTVVSRVV